MPVTLATTQQLLPLLLILPMLFAFVGASYIPIVDSDSAFPFLRSVDNPNHIMQWDSGVAVQILSSCKLIRITRRGVRCIAASDSLIVGWEQSFSSQSSLHYPHSAQCQPRRDALCILSDGRRFFPTNTVFVSETSVGRCLNGQGRMLSADLPTRTVMSSTGYRSHYPNSDPNSTTMRPIRDDVSLCDVLDLNMDIIYDPVHNRIFTKQLNDSGWLYMGISILVLTVVVLTAETVSQRSRSNLSHNIVAWVLLTGLSLLMLTRVDGRMHPFVTVQDRAFVAISAVYITVSTLYWISDTHTTTATAATAATATTAATAATAATTVAYSETQRGGINSMLGSIHFATCVLYGTPDNAYVSAFFFVFLFRCMQKLHDAHHNPEKWNFFDNTVLVLDAIYTTLVFTFGVLPHHTNRADTILYAAAQYVVCDAVAFNCVMTTSATEAAADLAATAAADLAATAATDLAADKEKHTLPQTPPPPLMMRPS
ncbi:hypothetical protein T484DRAFT_3629593 [Baffinella frigidus]|nr:hypothetical protein T484DRAFT_3629593 [Cryptophyta sp. CCMP2293]